MSEPNCPKCKRPYPAGWTVSVRIRQAENIRKALAESDMTLGRPRVIAYSVIYELRDAGMSIQKIADKLLVSRGCVNHALRKRKPSGKGG